jgi:alpha-beta hydrolase superfamily lysophospholipase
MMSFRNLFRSAWAVAAGLCVLFVILASLFPEPAHQIEYKRIANGLKMPLWIVVYHPQLARFAKAPAAVICQPINDPPEYGRMLELELVRDGFVVVTFDWRGRTSAENRQLLHTNTQEAIRMDVAAAVKYLRSLPEVDSNRVMIAGHSVGGTLAVDAGLADPTMSRLISRGTFCGPSDSTTNFVTSAACDNSSTQAPASPSPRA